MKFLCVPCDTPMKLQTVAPPDRGSLSVVYACPECGYEMAMLTNAYETQVVQSLGVRIGPDASGTASSAPGIGAHAKHVLGGSLAPKVWCYECHTVPTSVYTAGHVDSDLPAEVPMNGPLARTASDGIDPVPAHDFGTLTCANTYCHGNWRTRKSDSPNQFAYMDSVMTGANASPIWTGGSGEAKCGTCHHTIPDPPAAADSLMYIPQGHIPQPNISCGNCHLGVVDDEGKIADRTLHINGKINVFGLERSF